MMTRWIGPAVAAVLAAAAGCGGPTAGTVNGTVNLDGQPLKTGVVRFVPADGKSQTATAEVKDGVFTASVPPGEVRVEITAPKVVGKKKMYDTPESPTVDQIEELLPARYNTKTELKMTVRGGSQSEAFDLKLK